MSEEDLIRFGVDRLPTHTVGRSTSSLMDLTGRLAIVTGGGGSGLGQACAHRLAAEGANVALLDRDIEAAAAVARDVSARWDVRAEPFSCDITNWEAVESAVTETVRTFDRIDILVNNVGGQGPYGRFESQPKADIDTLVAKNFIGAAYVSRRVLDVMISSRSGKIVNIASEGGKVGMQGLVMYNSSKSGVIGFTRNLAHEVAQYGIYVNCVCPGIMMNDFIIDRIRSRPTDELGPLEESIRNVPIERGSLPEEVANVVAFLASDAASSVQGQAWSAGGGMSPY